MLTRNRLYKQQESVHLPDFPILLLTAIWLVWDCTFYKAGPQCRIKIILPK